MENMEIQEVEQKKVDDLMFKRIGVDVPTLQDSPGFSSNQAPARGLAVSNRFGYTVFAHSRGFTVAKTADLLMIAEKLNEEGSKIKTGLEAGVATVDLPNIRIVAFSSNELTVCACAGGSVNLYELASLVRKSDTKPFEVRKIDSNGDTYVRDFSWSPSESESYLIITSQGQLLWGRIGSAPGCKVEGGVLAAAWNEDGQQVAYVNEHHQLTIAKDFTKTFEVELPKVLPDVESELHVDSMNWVRPDSIIMGHVGVNSEGEEDEYPLFVLNSKNGAIGQEGSELVGLVFIQTSIAPSIVPPGSGPYMLTAYVKPWNVLMAASRKSYDDHIVLMGWLPEDDREAVYNVEVGNDVWIPRIELQENDDENAILGLAIDLTTVSKKLPDPRDESGDKRLPPCPILICLTLEGKLSFFTLARLDDKFLDMSQIVMPPSNVPDAKQPTPKASLPVSNAHGTDRASAPPNAASIKVEPPGEKPETKVLRQEERKGNPFIKPDDNKNRTMSVPPNFASIKVEPSEIKPETKIFNQDERKENPFMKPDDITNRATSVPPNFARVKVEPTEDKPETKIFDRGDRNQSPFIKPADNTKGNTAPAVKEERVPLSGPQASSSLLSPSFATVGKPVSKDPKKATGIPKGTTAQASESSKSERTSQAVDHKRSTSMSQAATGDRLEGSRPDIAPVPKELQKFGSVPSFSSSRDVKGSENVASTHESLFRPFNDSSKKGSAKTAPSPQINWGSQPSPVHSSVLSATSSVPQHKGQAFGTMSSSNASSTALGKGLSRSSSTAPTVTSSSSTRGQLGYASSPKDSSYNQPPGDRFASGSHSRTIPDKQSLGRAQGVTDMEATFITELEEVRGMSKDVDQLVSYIEGRWRNDSRNNPAAFTKQEVLQLEQVIHVLSGKCKEFRETLYEQKQEIEDLRDEEMRVDAWRIYARSLMDQKQDIGHLELWTRQKLHPELEMKRKHVFRADQDLKLQIAELEGHLHNLELKQKHQYNMQRRPNRNIHSPRQFVTVQNLYNTVNTQMAAADELDNTLAQMMEALNLSWPPSTKDSKPTAATILRSVGVITGDPSKAPTPLRRQRLSYSPMPKGPSTNRLSTPSVQLAEPSTQETVRRRRDSMDATWVNRETPRTTIKRVVRSKPKQSVSPIDRSMQGRPTSSDVQTMPSASLRRHVRRSQSSRMGQPSAVPSVSLPSSEAHQPSTDRTGFQHPSPFLESQQSRAGSAAAGTNNKSSKESLLKWTYDGLTDSSKFSPSTDSARDTFDGAGTSMTFNSANITNTLPMSFESTIPPARSTISAGTSDGAGGGTSLAAPSKSSSPFSRVGTTLTSRPAGESQLDGKRFGSREGSTKLETSSSYTERDSGFFQTGPSATTAIPGFTFNQQVTRPPPASLQNSRFAGSTGFPARSTASTTTGYTPTSLTASVSTSIPQVPAPAEPMPAVALKPATSSSSIPVAFQPAQDRKAEVPEQRKSPEKLGQTFSTSITGSAPVLNFPHFSRPDLSKASAGVGSLEPARSNLRASEVNEKLSAFAKVEEEAKMPKSPQQTSQQAPFTSFGQGARTRSFDLNSPPRLDTSSSASPFSSSTLSVSADPNITKSDLQPSLSVSSPTTKTRENTEKADVNLHSEGGLNLKQNEGDAETPLKSEAAAAVTSPPPISTTTSVPKQDIEAPPAISTDTSSTSMVPTLLSDTGTPPRTSPATSSSIFTASSPASTGGGPFAASDSSTNEVPAFPSPSQPTAGALSQSAGSPVASSNASAFATSPQQQSTESSSFGQPSLWQSSPQQPFAFPASSSTGSSIISTAAPTSPPLDESNEEDMEEETTSTSNTGVSTFGGFGGLGLGSSGSAAQQTEKANPFGASSFGNSQPFNLQPPTGGQLFRPAAFSLPAAQSSPQQTGSSAFGSGFGSPGFSPSNLFGEPGKGFGTPQQSSSPPGGGGFGQPAQLGSGGQQALGSAMGAFGQTRQVGFGTPFGASGMGSTQGGGGFGNTTPGGGGFASAGAGGGFANAAVSGGGFAGAAMGGGFAGAASGGGFGGAASGGGFGGAASGGGFGGAFGGNQGAQPGFGSAVPPPQSNLFTQMRK